MSSRHSVLTNAAAVRLAVGEWVGNVICTCVCIVVYMWRRVPWLENIFALHSVRMYNVLA